MTTTQLKQVRAIKPRVEFARSKCNGTCKSNLTQLSALRELRKRLPVVR